MEHYPLMNIYFPPSREGELYENMNRCATSPWSPKMKDAFERPRKDDSFYFHREVVDDEPSCTVCIGRKKEGHWVVQAIVPDKGQINPIPLDVYKAILTEFDTTIANQAAESVEGITAIEFSQYRLEDYFSPTAVGLLETFCTMSNQGDLGSDLSDQERWIAFLLTAYDDGKNIHCDIFGNCLKTAEWWPEHGIQRLVHEYDFAMRLLRQSGR